MANPTEKTPEGDPYAAELSAIAAATPGDAGANAGLNWLVNSAMMRLGYMPPSYALNNPPPSFAEGGQVDTSDVDQDSSLRKISDVAAELGPAGGAEARARLATGVASQFYGLDEEGNPQFLGSSHFLKNPDGSTSLTKGNPKFMDEILAAPSMLGKWAPKFSTDAAGRLAELNRRVVQQTGVGEAHGLPDHLLDAVGQLSSPIPMGAAGQKASLAKRLMELTGALRPATATRLLTDSAILGGANTASDKIINALPKGSTTGAIQ